MSVSQEELVKVYRARKTVLKMLDDRGYIVNREFVDQTLESFRQHYGMNAKYREELTILVPLRAQPDTKMIVFFGENKKMGVDELVKFSTRMKNENAKFAIIIAEMSPTPRFNEALNQLNNEKDVNLQLFDLKELLVNVTEHILVPTHQPLNDEQVRELLKRYKLKLSQLPRIQMSDPIARYYGLGRGAVVKIIRQSETADMSQRGVAFGFNPTNRLKTFLEPTVWHKITPLAQKYKAINLGQGFPGFSPPKFVQDALSRVTLEQSGYNYLVNQYARSQGDMRLVNNLAKQYSSFLHRTIDPSSEVIVCNGATGVIYNATHAFLNPGDEVVVFEPAFDIYTAQAAMCGAVVKSVPMRMRDGKWEYDVADFQNALSPKTRLVILNTPHNPTGKMFNKTELLDLAAALVSFPDVVVLSDEVYEHMTYGSNEHVRFADIKAAEYQHLNTDAIDTYERTITVSSAGKTFACTGWKVGWAVGPKHLIDAMAIVQSWVSFSVNTPAQVAITEAFAELEQPNNTYLRSMVEGYSHRKDMLVKLFNETSTPFAEPQGSFFIVIDISKAKIPQAFVDAEESRDWAFAKYAIENDVATIPCSVFYSKENRHIGENYVRIAFAQANSVMEQAVEKLRPLLQQE